MNREEKLKQIWQPVEKLKQRSKKHKSLEIKKYYRKRLKSKKKRYTYFILDKNQNAVKIGYSQNPNSRFNCFQANTLNKLKLLLILEGNSEKKLHQLFKQYHVKGEWFKYDFFLQVFVKRQKRQGRNLISSFKEII